MADSSASSPPTAVTSIDTTQKIVVPVGPRCSARVKWFDNKLTYGFATVLEGDHMGKDIFIHQSNILTLGQNVYRTLRMGEYIEFALTEVLDSEHKYQASAVTGPKCCPLMCETAPVPKRTFMPPTNGRGTVRAGRGGRGRSHPPAVMEVMEP